MEYTELCRFIFVVILGYIGNVTKIISVRNLKNNSPDEQKQKQKQITKSRR